MIKQSIIADQLAFPEGPAFAPDGSLWAVELNGACLLRIQENSVERFSVGGKPNGIAIDAAGNIWFCDAGLNQVRCFDPVTQVSRCVVHEIEGKPLDAPNDLAFDTTGNLVFTCPGNSRQEPTGYICCYRDGMTKKIAEQLYFPNGLAFSPGGNHLVVAETYRQRLWKGSWDSHAGEWQDKEVFADTGGPIGPDGMAFDVDGNLYVAVYGAASVKIFGSNGSILSAIPVNGCNPTNCAFDPSGKLGLVVTEAEEGLILSVDIQKKGAMFFH